MHWLERLNRNPGRLTLGQGTLEVFSWAYTAHLPDNQPHRHTHFEVCLVGAHGTGTFTAHGHDYALTPGTAFFARPGIIHQIVNTRQPFMELYWVAFQWTPTPGAQASSELDALWRAFAESDVCAVPDAQGQLGACWQALQLLANGDILAGRDQQIASLTTALLVAVAQLGAGANAPPPVHVPPVLTHDLPARLAMRYMHDNLGKPLTVGEIAQQSHTSARNLSRVFARFAGTSPMAYITQARQDWAQSLLQHTDMPIKEIAALVGYADVHHFTRVFSRMAGCPPGEYRLGKTNSVLIIHKDGATV